MGWRPTLLAGNTLLSMCDNVNANLTQSKAMPQKAIVSGNFLGEKERDKSVETNFVGFRARMIISLSEVTSAMSEEVLSAGMTSVCFTSATLSAMAVRLEVGGSGLSPSPLRLLDAGSG